MIKPRLFVDFDETLFAHDKYQKWLDQFLETKFGIEAGSYGSTIDSFHHQQESALHRLYDHERHIQSVTNRSWQFISGEIEHELKRAHQDFCFSDTHEFLEKALKSYELRILTYGNADYQRFKIRLCKKISNWAIPIHVTNLPKRVFLKQEFSQGQGLLIDDKHPLGLPANWKHVWLKRSAISQPIYEEHDGSTVISRLEQFFEAAER